MLRKTIRRLEEGQMGSTISRQRRHGNTNIGNFVRENSVLESPPIKVGNEPPAQVLRLLHSSIGTLSRALDRIAKYILENPETAVHQTIANVGLSSQTSQASVVRFCRVLGFAGFSEFKLSLAADLAKRPAPIRKDLDPSHAVIDHIKRSMTASIQEVCEDFISKSLTNVVDRIAASRQVYVVGMGSSHFLAEYLALCLLRGGIPAQWFRNAKLAHAVVNGLDADAVVIGISRTGKSPETARFLESARGAGAFTVAITDCGKSAVTRHADQVLLTDPMGSTVGDGELTMAIRIFLVEALTSLINVRTSGNGVSGEEEIRS